MPAIFISHSNLDRKEADDIKSGLARLGFEQVFLDFDKVTGIGAGESWEKRLYEEISRCHALVLVLTPNWLGSKWCFAELTQARALGKVILPIICKPLQDRLVLPDIQAVDLLDWNSGGLERMEQRLRAITDELARGFTLAAHRPPYPGILAFEAEDAAIYFGRDDETRAVIERLDARRTQGGTRFLIIIGASGAGKSSLLKAGVLPQLSRRKAQWIALPSMRPERSPLESLAKSIAQQIRKPDEWRLWHQRLASSRAIDHLNELLKDLRIGEARAATMLLPVDQLEEVFTVATPAERTAFLAVMAAVLDPKNRLPVMVVATGRSDVLEGLIETGDLAQLTETYPLPPMPLDRLSKLVEGPAAVTGLSVERGLADVIARDVGSAEALPLLAHTLWLLHRQGESRKRLSLADYHSLGDSDRRLNPIENSVRVVAERALDGTKPTKSQLEALRDAFIPHLVRLRVDDSRRVRQPARRSDLPQESLPLIDALIDGRLLSIRGTGQADSSSSGTESALVEVAHEALFNAWPTLNQWLIEEHAFLSDIERIKSAYEIWREAADHEKDQALLSGLLLSRAREWLTKYPRRFEGSDVKQLSAFILASATATDAAAQQVDLQRREQEERIKQSLDRAPLTQSRFLADMAAQEIINGDACTGILLAIEALPSVECGTDRPYCGEAELALFNATQCRFQEHRVLFGHQGRVWGVAFSSDRLRLLTASEDGTVRLWNLETGEAIAVLRGHTAATLSVAFDPDGQSAVTASEDGTARIWDLSSCKERAVLRGHDGWVWNAIFSPNGEYVVTSSEDKTARLWDAKNGKQLGALKGHREAVLHATFSPDGKRIVTASWDRSARIWDTDTLKEVQVLSGHGDCVWCAAFSPDGRAVVTASADKTARVWDLGNNTSTSLWGHGSWVWSAVFSRDGCHVLTASEDRTVRLWDVNTAKETATLKGHTHSVRTAVFSSDACCIATGSEDRTARIWTIDSAAPMSLVGHYAELSSVTFSPDGKFILTSSLDNTAILWDAKTCQHMMAFKGHEDQVRSAAFSPDGRHIVTASRDRTCRVWKVENGKEIASFIAPYVRRAAFSPDGQFVITALAEHRATLWDLKTGKTIRFFIGHSAPVRCAAFSPDGRRIVTAAEDNTARIWDVETGQEVMALRGHEGCVWGAVFNSNGCTIATASADETGRIWNAETGQSIGVLRGHSRAILSIAFSPNGQRLLTASEDRTARLWDLNTAKQIGVLRGHRGPVWSADFSPDGTLVATASGDRTGRVWRTFVSTRALVQYAKAVVPRGLTPEQRERYFLTPDPPAWYIDMKKWPYHEPHTG